MTPMKAKIPRRRFLGAAAIAGAALPDALPRILAAEVTASALVNPLAPIPVIDTHIHLFDPTRPQGVPWPAKDNAVLYQPALPDRYRKIATPLGVTGAIEVEASPWLQDNQWVLDVAAKDKIMVETVGDLEPGQ